MKVSNMMSSKGNKVANQFIVSTDMAEWFQSYDSVIVVKHRDGRIQLDSTYWNYSRTTSKYRSIFLNETKKQTQDKIDSGEYTLANLN